MKGDETPPVTLCKVLLRFREEFNVQGFFFPNLKNYMKNLEKAKKSIIKNTEVQYCEKLRKALPV